MTTIKHSLHGRLLGLDVNDYLTSPVGFKGPAILIGASGSEVLVADPTLTHATSGSTATAITNSGITTIDSTQNQTFTLAAPTAAGLEKYIVTTTAATGNVVQLASGTFDGKNNQATFTAKNANIDLIAISTSVFSLTGQSSLNTLVVLSTF